MIECLCRRNVELCVVILWRIGGACPSMKICVLKHRSYIELMKQC